MKMRMLSLAVAGLAMAGTAGAQSLTTDAAKASYYFGYRAGAQMSGVKESGEQLDVEAAIKGLREGFAKTTPALTEAQIKPVMDAMERRMQARQKAEFDKAAVSNKAESDKFLAANRAKPGVRVLPSGVQYRVIEAGAGAKPTQASTVNISVSGPYPLGQRPEQAQPAQNAQAMKVSEIDLAGIREALVKMPTGAKWEITLPPERAFGADINRGFPPNVAVQFEVKLNSIR